MHRGTIHMSTNLRALERIETAFNTEPFCSCGKPTTVVARGGDLYLVCATLEEPRGRIGGWLRRPDVVHVSRPIIEDVVLDRAS
jgi:hypothetical protein